MIFFFFNYLFDVNFRLPVICATFGDVIFVTDFKLQSISKLVLIIICNLGVPGVDFKGREVEQTLLRRKMAPPGCPHTVGHTVSAKIVRHSSVSAKIRRAHTEAPLTPPLSSGVWYRIVGKFGAGSTFADTEGHCFRANDFQSKISRFTEVHLYFIYFFLIFNFNFILSYLFIFFEN